MTVLADQMVTGFTTNAGIEILLRETYWITLPDFTVTDTLILNLRGDFESVWMVSDHILIVEIDHESMNNAYEKMMDLMKSMDEDASSLLVERVVATY